MQVQNDVQNTGNDQKQQRNEAVSDSTQDIACQVEYNAGNSAAHNDNKIAVSIIIDFRWCAQQSQHPSGTDQTKHGKDDRQDEADHDRNGKKGDRHEAHYF